MQGKLLEFGQAQVKSFPNVRSIPFDNLFKLRSQSRVFDLFIVSRNVTMAMCFS